MRPAAPLSLVCLFACLPGAPPLSGDSPSPDLGAARDTWSEEDLPSPDPYPTPDDAEAEEDSGGVGPGDETDGPPVLDPGLSQLRITELLADPDGKDGGLQGPEFIELLNPSAQPVALAGLVIEARSWPTVTAADLGVEGLELPAGHRLVVLRYAKEVVVPPELPTVDDEAIIAAFGTAGGLRNEDGGALVRGAEGEVADLIVYGAVQPAPFDDPVGWLGMPTALPPAGSSLCRNQEETDGDGPDDWAPCEPTPGTSSDADPPGPPVPATGNIVVTEVLANPPGPANTEKLLEFVEVQNADDHAVDLGAFSIADAIEMDAPGIDPVAYLAGDGGCQPDTCLAPGRRAIIVGSAYVGDAGDALVLVVDDSTLADAGLGLVEPIILRDGDGAIVSSYRDWPDPQVQPNPTGMELAVVRSGLDTADLPEHWALTEPTPGT